MDFPGSCTLVMLKITAGFSFLCATALWAGPDSQECKLVLHMQRQRQRQRGEAVGRTVPGACERIPPSGPGLAPFLQLWNTSSVCVSSPCEGRYWTNPIGGELPPIPVVAISRLPAGDGAVWQIDSIQYGCLDVRFIRRAYRFAWTGLCTNAAEGAANRPPGAYPASVTGDIKDDAGERGLRSPPWRQSHPTFQTCQ